MTCISVIETKQKGHLMGYTKDEFLAETGISERGSQPDITRREREQRKALQFAEAENLVEHFLENRLDPKFSEAWNLDLSQVRIGEIPPKYFLDMLGKLDIFRTDPLGEKQAIHRVLVALVKANILKRQTMGSVPGIRVFKIVDVAHFRDPMEGEQLADMRITNLGE